MNRREILTRGLPMAALAGAAGSAPAMALPGPGIFPMIGSALWMPPWGSTGTTANGRSTAVNVSKNAFIRVQIWGDLVGVVTIEERSMSATVCPWFPVATLTNPLTSVGEYWSVPVTMWLSILVAGYVSGTAYAVLETHV